MLLELETRDRKCLRYVRSSICRAKQDIALLICVCRRALREPFQPELAKLNDNGYTLLMVLESIREFNRTVPFKPYAICMASGERYTVPHPDFVSISPKGSFVIVFDKNEHPYHLST